MMKQKPLGDFHFRFCSGIQHESLVTYRKVQTHRLLQDSQICSNCSKRTRKSYQKSQDERRGAGWNRTGFQFEALKWL